VLIYVFGARKPPPPVPLEPAPSLALVDVSHRDWLALNNAALFALPGNNGFAASMWTELPPLNIHKQGWKENPHWLAPSNSIQMRGLFAAFDRFVKTNRFARVHFQFSLSPQVAAPATPMQPPLAQKSVLAIQGGLSGRPLLTPLKLPSWSDSDVDTPSIVQVLVNAAGNVVSAVLLPQEVFAPATSWEPSFNHNKLADQWALETARTLHFAPVASSPAPASNAPPPMAIGKLVFDWRVIPQTDTNVSHF
ncbi:MAG: hypothetical protein ACRED1_01265, partial [Limisphaerales bacterium]